METRVFCPEQSETGGETEKSSEIQGWSENAQRESNSNKIKGGLDPNRLSRPFSTGPVRGTMFSKINSGRLFAMNEPGRVLHERTEYFAASLVITRVSEPTS
jgi:hypothetical protein